MCRVYTFLHAAKKELKVGGLRRVPLREALKHFDNEGIESTCLTLALLASLSAKNGNG
jgi:hypothetical protein